MAVGLYYWKAHPNFGDLLASLLLKRFAKIDSEWSPANEADIVIVGSILEHLSTDYNGVIAGCGKLHISSKLSFPKANILSVRGFLTAKALGLKNITVGDPGLLADELVPLPEKEYNLGIVPHWTDHSLEKRPEFLKYKPKIIRPEGDPLEVIREIGKCKKIVASSLHGIVLADAFGIPRRVELAPKMVSHVKQEGGMFKWLDYSSSIDMRFEIGVTQEADRYRVLDKQSEIFDVFEQIKKIFKWSNLRSAS